MSVIDALKSELVRHGATDFRIETGGKHNRLYWTFDGREMFHVISHGDKDINQRLILAIQDVRRMIGVNQGSGPGIRKQKSVRQKRTTTTSLPIITIKPDPLLALLPLKEKLEKQMSMIHENPYGAASSLRLSTEVVMVNPKVAASILKNCPFDHQRPIRIDHVKRLAEEMKRGWFLAGTPVFLCVLPNQKQVLVNGQHTISAVEISNVTIPLTFIRQNVASLEEAAAAYACFDIQRSRSWMDAARAHGMGDKIPMLSAALSAMKHIMANFGEGRDIPAATLQSRHARFDAIKNYQGTLMSLSTMLADTPIANQRAIRRSAVMAVAMVTIKAQPSMGEEFWGGMAKDDGLRVGDPRRTLLKYLHANTVRSAQGDMLRATALAWNAYFENRTIEHCKPGNMKLFRLRGTTWGAPSSDGSVKKDAKISTVKDAQEAELSA